MLSQTIKQSNFDLYWQTRDLEKADLRSQQRSEIVYSLLSQKAGRLLDAGCGRGWNSAFFQQKGFNVEAFDISPEEVDLTRQRGIPAQILDLEQDRLEGEYDVILCLEVLQFVIDPLKVLLKLESALKPRGELILSLPNEFHILRRIKILFGQPDLGGYNAPHIRFFSPKEIRRLIRSTGLEIVNAHPVSFIPPSFGYLSRMGDFLARIFPGLFSLSLLLKTTKRAR